MKKVIATVAIILALGLLSVFLKPELLINTVSLRAVSPLIPQLDFLDRKSIKKIRLTSVSFWKKKLTVELQSVALSSELTVSKANASFVFDVRKKLNVKSVLRALETLNLNDVKSRQALFSLECKSVDSIKRCFLEGKAQASFVTATQERSRDFESLLKIKFPEVSKATAVFFSRFEIDDQTRIHGSLKSTLMLAGVSPKLKIATDFSTNRSEELEERSVKFSSKLSLINASGVRFAGEFSGNFDQNFRNFPGVQCDLPISIASFAQFLNLLRETGMQIDLPAPFHQFDGPIEIVLRCAPEPLVSFRVNLRSQNQVLKFHGHSNLAKMANSTGKEVFTEIVIDHAVFVAPPIDAPVGAPVGLGSVPSLVPIDSTPRLSGVQKSKAGLKHTLKIHSGGKPVFIKSHFAKNPIPLIFELDVRESDAFGKVEIRGAEVNLFRRKADIERLLFNFGSRSAVGVNGRIRVQYADYTVFVDLAGDLEEPFYHLSSIPELPEDQLISVLLFGEPYQNLTEEQAESVGALRAAIADKSLRLASFYLLASTPIESVSYNAGTGVFYAKLRLRDGTSLKVGSDFTQTLGVGIRQRVGRGWSLYSGVEYIPMAEQRTFLSLLEWFKRF